MMNKNIRRKELLHIVTKLHTLFSASDLRLQLDLKLSIKIVSAMFRWVTCEGDHGLKRAKTMSNIAIRHLMGTPLKDKPLSNRYTRLISKAIRGSNCYLSTVYWISIFCAVRLFRLRPCIDTSTITSRFKGNLLGLLNFRLLSSLKATKESFRDVTRVMDQKWSPKFSWHISGASGPNGSVAYAHYLDDLRALRYSWLQIGLLVLFCSIPFVNKRETVKALGDALKESLFLGDQNAIHSRLVFLSDKAGKTRVVAIGDILSQSVLKVVHQRCNLFLRHLPQDGTFDQDSARNEIKKMSLESLELASIDLVAVTDRMPALFQAWVLIYLRVLTPLQAFAWYWVITRRDFVYKVDGVPKCVRYKVGQPMGLLSSWPAMAISHHFLVRWSFAAHGLLREIRKARYCVLGDDLTMHNNGAADYYLQIIKCLGIDFSEEKTYLGKGMAEFAKSLFRQGDDLTPFPLALLRFNKNTIVSNTLAIMTECKRINLPLTHAILTGLFPKRWRNLVLLAALSPSSPRNALDLQSRDDQWIFLHFVYQKKLKYFSNFANLRNSVFDFMIENPGKSGRTLSSPFLQIAMDNGENYPVLFPDTCHNPQGLRVVLGSNWISYDTHSWPDGIPPLGDHRLIPGMTWKKDCDDVFYRSSLTSLNKLLPGYFHTRCVGKQVGE